MSIDIRRARVQSEVKFLRGQVRKYGALCKDRHEKAKRVEELEQELSQVPARPPARPPAAFHPSAHPARRIV